MEVIIDNNSDVLNIVESFLNLKERIKFRSTSHYITAASDDADVSRMSFRNLVDLNISKYGCFRCSGCDKVTYFHRKRNTRRCYGGGCTHCDSFYLCTTCYNNNYDSFLRMVTFDFNDIWGKIQTQAYDTCYNCEE